MIWKVLRLTLPFAMLAGCATNRAAAPEPAPGAPMVAGTVNIWRGVRVLPNSTHIDWSNVSFGVSGPVPTLSFFDAHGGNTQPCWLRLTVNAPNVPVPPGQGGVVAVTIPGPPPPPPPPLPSGGPAPSPWAAVFDNNPPGHWSILKTTITNNNNAISNAVAGTWAGAVFRASTIAGQVAIVDGSVVGCQQ